MCVFAIESHTVGVIEKQNIQWPLEFSVSGFYGNIFSILWNIDIDIFLKNAFFKIKSRVIYQIKGFFITNFLINFNLSIYEPIASYWRNKSKPAIDNRTLSYDEREREREKGFFPQRKSVDVFTYDLNIVISLTMHVIR